MSQEINKRLRNRFALLDHHLEWYEGFNVNEIARILDLTRQNVSKLIQAYKEVRPKESFIYDQSKKKYIKGPGFQSNTSIEGTQQFLDHIRGQDFIGQYRLHEEWDPMEEIYFMDLDKYGCPQPEKNIVKLIMLGLTKQKILKIRYQSRRKERFLQKNFSRMFC